MEITAEHLTQLAEIDDGVIACWPDIDDDVEGLPVDFPGTVLNVEPGETVLWLGTRQHIRKQDHGPAPVGTTPVILVDGPSAEQWIDLADGDVDLAAKKINAQIVHDADPGEPDCDDREATGYTCTLLAGHTGDHVAGLGQALIGAVFSEGSDS